MLLDRFLKNIVLLRNANYSSLVSNEYVPTNIIPKCEINMRTLRVVIIGLPNAGKSTLINNLMDRKVCPVSNKVHTTRKKTTSIFTADEAQIVFVDTPGLVSDKEQKKFHLEKSFVRDCKEVSKGVDMIGVIHDVSNIWTREKLDIKIINILEKFLEKPSFLILNKVDILKSKRKLLDVTRQVTQNYLNGKPIPGKHFKDDKLEYKGWPNFQEIFMVSALTGDGTDLVKDYLVKNAKPGKWLYSHEMWTDQTAESIITDTVRAAFLDFLPQEIPYRLKLQLEYLKIKDNDDIITSVLVHCPSSRIAKLIAGAADGRLRQITEKVQRDLQETFYTHVKIQIVLKYNENN